MTHQTEREILTSYEPIYRKNCLAAINPGLAEENASDAEK